MKNLAPLKQALQHMAGLTEADFKLSEDYWVEKDYKKGEYYNEYRHVCKYLGFTTEGVFRSYYIDSKTEEEKNVFFFSKNQIVVSYQSFVTQMPCNYYTQAMTDAKVLHIHIDHLTKLYSQSHAWERIGRLIAEMAFGIAMQRTEGFLFRSPEERYLELIAQHPEIFHNVPLYHISSYLGIQGPSLSRIRKRLVSK